MRGGGQPPGNSTPRDPFDGPACDHPLLLLWLPLSMCPSCALEQNDILPFGPSSLPVPFIRPKFV